MTLTLRPHHVLCWLGYVGYGYSPEFIQEMGRIAALIRSGRVRTVILKSGFDNICRACPHHRGECRPEHLGPKGEKARDLDKAVLRALKLKQGHPYPLPEIKERIAALTADQFNAVCVGCEWHSLGECLAGQQRLVKEIFPAP